VSATPFGRFTQRERRAIARQARRYGAFLGLPVVPAEG
jgi:hypothetical protein